MNNIQPNIEKYDQLFAILGYRNLDSDSFVMCRQPNVKDIKEIAFQFFLATCECGILDTIVKSSRAFECTSHENS